MRKQIISALYIVLCILMSCSTPKPVTSSDTVAPPKPKFALSKGDNFEVITQATTGLTQEVMGQSMEISSVTTSTNQVTVKDITDTKMLLTNTVTKIKTSATGAGTEQSYDSEKPGDTENETGKIMGKLLNVPVEVWIDETGSATRVKQDSSNDAQSAIQSMMMGTNDSKSGGLGNFYCKYDASKLKTGDSWVDSVKDETSKTITTYTVKEISGGSLTLDYTASTAVNTTQENMGMEIIVSLSLKSTGTQVYDVATKVLKQNTVKLNGTGTAEAAGMTIPITMNTTTTVTVTKK